MATDEYLLAVLDKLEEHGRALVQVLRFASATSHV